MRNPRVATREDTIGRIDRCLADRTFRLNVGLCLEPDFLSMTGCLFVVNGRGKFMRVRHATSASENVPPEMRRELVLACQGESNLSVLHPLLYDLACVQANVVEQLKIKAGKAVDRILTVSTVDPGCWSTDFDGRMAYFSLCDANRLAELTGITIVDAFPSRDISVGGTGRNLDCLPIWIAYADRDPVISTEHRVVLNVGSRTTAFRLPPSDGLDAEVPDINVQDTVGLELVARLLNELLPNEGDHLRERSLIANAYINGQIVRQLDNAWRQLENQPSIGDRIEKWVATAVEYESEKPGHLDSLIRTAQAIIAESVELSLNDRAVDRVMIFCETGLRGTLINLFSQTFPKSHVQSATEFGEMGCQTMGALTASLLGLMHIDQMPANLPWITGASSQRILGRFTPGRPSNWRQLVLDMADFCPPAMKLKDAV